LWRNGLIEINGLADINNFRNGAALYKSFIECPTAGCIGFELTQHLDMDTDQGGVMDGDNGETG